MMGDSAAIRRIRSGRSLRRPHADLPILCSQRPAVEVHVPVMALSGVFDVPDNNCGPANDADKDHGLPAGANGLEWGPSPSSLLMLIL
jgi:hypothetical protein